MKTKKVLALLMVACMTFGLAACGSSSASDDTSIEGTTEEESVEEAESEEASDTEVVSADNDYEFIFVSPLVGLEYWNTCAEGIAAADEDFGTTTQVVGGTDSSTMLADYLSYFEAAISSQPDAIFTYCGVESAYELIEEASEAGIPVLAVDSDAPDTSRIAYVGTDPYNAGYMTGEAMIEYTGGSAKVVVLTSSLTAEKEQEEIEAFIDAVADYDIEIIATEETNADLSTGVTKMEALVNTYPEMTAVLCTSAYDVQAAAQVKVEQGLDDLVLIGYDDQEETLEYIREGVIDAIVVQDPYTMGYMAVELLTEYLNTGSLESESYDTGTILVTNNNVDSYK
ncbi:MAG: substrate-binding domain-containing protein [Lachnospiraceae bacterium]|nr:substrate-binding domain-containing protein [Lachnospiraceae bacterium]